MSGATPERETDGSEEESGRSYSGLLTAFPYAFRESDSRLFRSYAVIGGLLALVIVLLFGFSLIVLVAATTGGVGGSLTLSRSFFIVIGLLIVAPVLAPVLLVARHHRRVSADRGYDAALAAVGYSFFLSLYVALVITIPAGQQSAPMGPLAPVVRLLYALPAPAGLLPPLAVVAALYLVHRTRK